jgi:hypothetical protein
MSEELIYDGIKVFTRNEFTLDLIGRLHSSLDAMRNAHMEVRINAPEQYNLTNQEEWLDGFCAGVEIANCIILGKLPTYEIQFRREGDDGTQGTTQ